MSMLQRVWMTRLKRYCVGSSSASPEYTERGEHVAVGGFCDMYHRRPSRSATRRVHESMDEWRLPLPN
eukprot:1872305-Alexandrium_andersonii.AAC.1